MTCSNGGESARGVPYLACRGGGRSMAQRDPHVALIISTTNMWGKNFWWKKFSMPKLVFRHLWLQHLFLHKTRGLPRKPISLPCPPPPGAIFSRQMRNEQCLALRYVSPVGGASHFPIPSCHSCRLGIFSGRFPWSPTNSIALGKAPSKGPQGVWLVPPTLLSCGTRAQYNSKNHLTDASARPPCADAL